MSKSLFTKIVESTAPTTSTVGVVGQWYLDTTTKKLYECKSITTENNVTSYKWEEVGGSAGEPIAEAIRDNTTQIGTTGFKAGGANAGSNSYGIAIGRGSRAHYTGDIVIGNISNAIGGNTEQTSAIAIGNSAEARAANAIQLGGGTNLIANTFKVRTDNIYNISTHTLTVQNIELNGTDINTVIANAISSAVTTALNTAV